MRLSRNEREEFHRWEVDGMKEWEWPISWKKVLQCWEDLESCREESVERVGRVWSWRRFEYSAFCLWACCKGKFLSGFWQTKTNQQHCSWADRWRSCSFWLSGWRLGRALIIWWIEPVWWALETVSVFSRCFTSYLQFLPLGIVFGSLHQILSQAL